MSVSSWFYKLLRQDLVTANSVWKFFGFNKIADKMNAKITEFDNQVKQGETPSALRFFPVITVALSIIALYFFRKPVIKLIKKIF